MMRVFIADDEEIIRDGIRNCIEKEQERFLFAGEAPDGEMALSMLMEMKPDVLITDIRMPFMDGLELARLCGAPCRGCVLCSSADTMNLSMHRRRFRCTRTRICSSRSARRSCLKQTDRLPSRLSRSSSSFARKVQNSRSEHEEDVLREHFSQRPALGQRADCGGGCTGERWGCC